jgi:hypothetical protein
MLRILRQRVPSVYLEPFDLCLLAHIRQRKPPTTWRNRSGAGITESAAGQHALTAPRG